MKIDQVQAAGVLVRGFPNSVQLHVDPVDLGRCIRAAAIFEVDAGTILAVRGEPVHVICLQAG